MDTSKRLNIEQAIRIAQAHKKELLTPKEDADLNPAARFAISLNIREGKHKASPSAIYDAYLKWEVEKPVSKLSFFQNFSKLFNKQSNLYNINYKPVALLRAASKVKTEDV